MIPSLKTTDQSLQLEEVIVQLTATGAGFSRSDVVQCPVNSDGSYTTCITPTAAGIGTVASAICSDAIFGVVLGAVDTSTQPFGAVAQNKIANVLLRGKVDATLLSSGGAAYAVDAPMFVNTSKQLEIDQAGGDGNKKIVALATAAATTGTSTPTALTVLFDGIGGFSRCGGSAS